MLCVQQGGPRPNSISQSSPAEKSLLTTERQLPCYYEAISFLPSTPSIQGTRSGLARSDSSTSELEWFSFGYNLGNSRGCSFRLTWSAVQISSRYISIWHIMHALWRDILQTNPTEFPQGCKHLSKTVAISVCTFKPLHMAGCSSVPQSCPTLYKTMDCSMPGSSVLHCLWEIAQIYVH